MRINLLLLIPFYIFSHETRFEEYEKDKAKLEALQKKYGQIKNKLEELLNQGIEQGIERTVSILKNLGVPAQTILVKIQEQYNLSPETSEKYL